jgi:glycosyltransferase involved in cell wall biosynthesis
MGQDQDPHTAATMRTVHDRPMIPAERPLHVLQVDPNANTPPYDRALCEALADAGCQVELLTSRFLYEELADARGVRLDERFFRLAGSRLAARAGLVHRPSLRRAAKAAEYPLDWLPLLARLGLRRGLGCPDLIHVQWTVQPTLDLSIWRLLKRLGVPLVYTVHNLVPHHARPDDRRVYGRLYRAADALVVHSERSARALREEWGIPGSRITVVPMGPMLEAWPAMSRGEARRSLGLPLDAEIVLFAGLIEPYKGLGDAIEAFGRFADRRPQARLVIAGKPNESFEGYRQQLDRLHVLDRTTLDLRFLPEPTLAAYLCAADVMVLPYRSATSSAMLLAARRFGCSVVASDVGDLGELIVDGKSGLLVPPGSPDRLGVAVERLLADRKLAQRLGQAGQAQALGPHSWPWAARRTVELYHRLVSDRR